MIAPLRYVSLLAMVRERNLLCLKGTSVDGTGMVRQRHDSNRPGWPECTRANGHKARASKYRNHRQAASRLEIAHPSRADEGYNTLSQRSTMATYDFAASRRHAEDMLGYEFTNLDYLQGALHAGDPVEIGEKLVDDRNKKLAVVGDAALDLALAVTSYEGGASRSRSDEHECPLC